MKKEWRDVARNAMRRPVLELIKIALQTRIKINVRTSFDVSMHPSEHNGIMILDERLHEYIEVHFSSRAAAAQLKDVINEWIARQDLQATPQGTPQ